MRRRESKDARVEGLLEYTAYTAATFVSDKASRELRQS